jgi:hypothetical protein
MKVVLLFLFSVFLFANAADVVVIFDLPSDDITGLAYGNGSLWAVDSDSHTLYELDPSDGTILSQFNVSVAASHEITGLAFYNNILYVGENYPGGTSSGYVYKYTTTGVFQGSVDVVC